MSHPSRVSRPAIACMVEGALCVALAVVLAKLDLFQLPQGGSVDLELVPLLLFAWRWGARRGIGVGALSGVVRILLGAHVYHPVQAVLDYPLAFACTGLAGLMPRRAVGRAVGTALACACQLACHVASGAIFFAQYAPEGQGPLMYSLIYNGSIIVPKYVLSTIVAWILWKALRRALPSREA